MKKHLLFLLASLWILSVSAQNINPTDDAIYRSDEVAIIKITMSEEDKAFLLAPENSYLEEYMESSIQMINSQMDTVVSGAGVRLRGNTSRNHDKKGFKIDFREFDGSKFYGYKKFNLKPNVNDPSAFREQLSMRFFREMQVPAARTHLTQLYINEEYMGVYLNVEQVDDEFLENRHGHSEGYLYKCGYGANLQDNGQVFDPVIFESEINKDTDTRAELDHFVEVLNTTPSANFKEAIEEVFDVDRFLRYLAVEALIGHWDGYSYNQNNYYLFYNAETQKVELFPYDTDNTWGIDWVDRDWATRDLRQWVRDESQPRPLANKILAQEEYKARYHYYLSVLMQEFFTEEFVHPLLDEAEEMLAEAIQEDTYYPLAFGFGFSDFENAFHSGTFQHVEYGIRSYLQTRRGTALEQMPQLLLSESGVLPHVVPYPFPNPSVQPSFYISHTGKPAQVSVYSMDGKSVALETVEKEATRSRVQLPQNLPFGLYVIHINGQAYKWFYEGN
ncbi:CotH kinase family protein [Cytophagales bacterium LB-30]|uniref:CotH kinase family protein n=1 Tax=Shiella aurantiaca TaxID=3058365 RepID=A0ABT8F2M2_9BACT|nr:CotH kinase family protein [Shiella aurantiaca]MDN4164469.1 CotH kinase family protein [Shiella aurantiaca]